MPPLSLDCTYSMSKENLLSTHIDIQGARTHNLKNISVRIPKNQLTVVTGVSGSGKSSLVFDTLYAEGQRRYLEAFGSYVRQFMGELERPDVDSITGISPVVSIDQKTTSRNPRSTVGTVTEIYDFLRLLYARIGKAYSMHTGRPMVAFQESELLAHLFATFRDQQIIILSPVIRGRKGHYRELFADIAKKGYVRVRIDGELQEISHDLALDRYKSHTIEIVIDQLSVKDDHKDRIMKSLSEAMRLSGGIVYILSASDSYKKTYPFSKKFICEDTGISYDDPSPLSFSFNSPYGYCTTCKGLGFTTEPDVNAIVPDYTKSIEQGAIAPVGEERDSFFYNIVKATARQCKIKLNIPFKQLSASEVQFLFYGNAIQTNPYSQKAKFEGIVNLISRWYNDTGSESIRISLEKYFCQTQCAKCKGQRLKLESLYFKLADKNIAELADLPLEELSTWVSLWKKKLSPYEQQVAKDVIKEIEGRLTFLLDVGLYYLKLNRAIASLSGGESQRIRLATQIGSQLQGITYVLDEPSIGLHPRDNHRLIRSLKNLRDIGNTVVVVEHDEEIMEQADYLIDIGPGAGVFGGEIVAEGKPADFSNKHSVTAKYLSKAHQIAIPATRRKGNGNQILLKKVSGHNLKNIDVAFPLGTFTVVTGVSGSGKSTLIGDTLYPLLHNHCYKTNKQCLSYGKIEGLEYIDKIIEVDQSPIGRTPRSCPATYSGFYTDIRNLFASLPDAQLRGLRARDFSFNLKGGRCETCEGVGVKTIQMNFLPDVYISCDKCYGKRFERNVLDIRYQQHSIFDVLDMSVDNAVELFKTIPYLYKKIKVLQDVGLGYIKLGQNAVTLSGGEAQRVKLSSELIKQQTGKTVYILDEPTTGLHTQDIAILITALQQLVNKGNTVILVEHNLDIIKVADYLIDLGEEGGDKGGTLIATGTPEELVKLGKGHTAHFLRKALEKVRTRL